MGYYENQEGPQMQRPERMNADLKRKLIQIAAVIIFFGILFCIGQIFKKDLMKFKNSQAAKVFPKPAQMPPKLDISVKDALGRLQKAMDKHRRGLAGRMKPGLKPDELTKAVNDSNINIPKELGYFYMWHNGSSKSAKNLQWFVPLEVSLENVLKKRTTYKKLNSGSIASRGMASMTGYIRNWVPLYQDAAYYSLNVDVSRKPEDGAYFWTGSNAGGFFFFPSLQNALIALAECFEQESFKAIKSTEKKNSVLDRNDQIMDVKQKQLLVNSSRLKKVMEKYGVWMKADGVVTR